MFTKINILNISIWSFAGFLFLIAVVLIILRLMKIDIVAKIKKEQPKDVGKVSNDMQQLILSLDALHNINVGYNILFKNKYSKNNYSLIPAICERDDVIFLITNRIKVSKNNILITSDKKAINLNKKNTPSDDFKFSWYKDVKKYIEKLDENLKIEIILPILGDFNKVKNESNLTVLEFSNVGDYISRFPSTNNKKKVLEKLKRDNLFKGTGKLNETRVRELIK